MERKGISAPRQRGDHMKRPRGGKELNMTTGGLCDWMAEHERNAAQYEASM